MSEPVHTSEAPREHDYGFFSRVVCGCGVMHTYCDRCGVRGEYCSAEEHVPDPAPDLTRMAHRTWREVRAEVYGPRTLTEFLLARIAEDEEAAHAADSSPWRLDEHPSAVVRGAARNVAHIARHDPARVLAECEAKRLTVRFLSDLVRGEFGDTMTASIAHSVLCRMAVPYADHPDYQEEWRP